MAARGKATVPIDECLFGGETISLAELRRIASQGIVDQGSHRAVAWRILLGYLPETRDEWELLLDQKRQSYLQLISEVFVGPPDDGKDLQGHHGKRDKAHRDKEERRRQRRAAERQSSTDTESSSIRSSSGGVAVEESPTKAATESTSSNGHVPPPPKDNDSPVPARLREQWKQSGRESSVLEDICSGTDVNTLRRTEENWEAFYESASLLDEIRKDVVRTHPDLYFFLEPNLGTRRYAAMERILFLWSFHNKGVRYVQGMNEIVGTLYFVLANDFNQEWACHAEADTFFLFSIIMEEMRDVYVAALDHHDTGIQGRIANMHSLLSLHDPEVCFHLEECGIHASFYAIRWLTTLLSREFLLPDTIRLWDSMFASTHKDNFLRYVCVTMVLLVREDLLKGDFSTCLRLLQSYPPTNLETLLESSRALWIYESQITLACHKGGISLSQALTTISPPPSVIMAYGLPGGVALKRSAAAASPATKSAANESEVVASGRALVKNAKDFFGGLGREVMAMNQNVQARRNSSNK